MATCLFATDLHGQIQRYEKLLASIVRDRPAAVFLGGELLPSDSLSRTPLRTANDDFVSSYLIPAFAKVRDTLGEDYPAIFLILGNDDPRCEEEQLIAGRIVGSVAAHT